MASLLDEILNGIYEAGYKAARYNLQAEIVVIVSFDSYVKLRQGLCSLHGIYFSEAEDRDMLIMGARILVSETLKEQRFKVLIDFK